MSNTTRDERELLSKPGDTILETLEHFKMNQAELAERMGKTPSKINDLISGKEPITVATSLQLEKVLGIDAQFWLNREINYREKLSRLDQEEALEECIEWLKQQPIKQLKQFGYLKSEEVNTAMVAECLQFYGVASTVQWETLYIDEYATTSFRKSGVHKTALGSLAASLRIGEIEVRKRTLPTYSKEGFKQVLTKALTLVKKHPEDFAQQLQQLCFEVGVALIYTICLPKAPISGATRWIGGTPLIQLTDRYKSNDQFWFTFYHEAAHVLLHGKKDVFLEDFEGSLLNLEKEKEADEFAVKWLLPEDFLEDLPAKITERDISKIARQLDTHPAIILGRLQHLNKVSYSFGSTLKMKVALDEVIKEQSNI